MTNALKVTLARTGSTVVSKCFEAKTMRTRLVGLLGHDKLNADEALLLMPCNHVHTWFMRFPIDAVFLNRDDEIVGIDELAPWKLSRLHWKSRKVLELPAGTAQKLSLRPGDRLEFTCSK